MIYVAGPGHGGPGLVANTYLEGTYSEVYPNIPQNAEGMKRLFTQFSFPGGIPSHVAPETPGSIHEGGQLGYSLLHAYGAVFDNPGLLACCVVGDGEAETGALSTSWHSNKCLNPARDGAVIPILHLNGYKIAGPTVLARIGKDELAHLFMGYGYRPYFVEGHEPESMHQAMAATLEAVLAEIQSIQKKAREDGDTARPQWPMMVLRTPKGWTGPKEVDGHPVEGTFRALPLADSPPDLPPHQPRQSAREGLQGRGHHHNPVRHGGHERSGPLPPGRGRDRPRSRVAQGGGAPEAVSAGQVDRAQVVHLQARRRHARDSGLAVAGLMVARLPAE
jgi:phosphoketolase